MPGGEKEPDVNMGYTDMSGPRLHHWMGLINGFQFTAKQNRRLVNRLLCTFSDHKLRVAHMTNIFKIHPVLIFSFSLVIMFSTAVAVADEGLLDGKIFIGRYREKHKSAVKEDVLKFMNGEFHSRGYGQSGFNEGVYQARAEEDRIHFEAETVSPKHGKIKWRGIVQGDAIEVNYQWRKKGWLSDTQKDYLFIGTLKK